MPKSGPDRDETHLDDMLEAARLIRGYMRRVTFEQFWGDNEKRDAVALRLTVIGEAASHVSERTQKTLSTIPFQAIRGLRNRLVHDYGSIDFRIVWQVTQTEITPLIRALEGRHGKKSSRR